MSCHLHPIVLQNFSSILLTDDRQMIWAIWTHSLIINEIPALYDIYATLLSFASKRIFPQQHSNYLEYLVECPTNCDNVPETHSSIDFKR